MSDNDLKKLMAKMNDNKQPVEKPIEQSAPVEQVPQTTTNVPQPAPAPAEIPDDLDEEDVEQVPAKQEDDQNSVEQEVAVLQNVGIFRRERILIEREKVDVLKVIAQTLLDIKKKLLGGEDATKD